MPFIRDKKKLSGKLILDDPIIYLFFCYFTHEFILIYKI